MFFEHTSEQPGNGNRHLPGPEHPFRVRFECLIGYPCCNGSITRPVSDNETFDLSEHNEDLMVKAAADIVRQAFANARGFSRTPRIMEGWEPGRPGQRPHSGG